MTARWGTKPFFLSKIKIEDESEELEHGEYYSLEETHRVWIPIVWEGAIEQFEREKLAEARAEFEKEDVVSLIYGEFSVVDVGVIPGQDYEIHTVYIVRANHPIAATTIIAIGIAIAIIIGSVIIAYGFYHVEVSAGGWMGGFGGVIVIVAIVILLLFWVLGRPKGLGKG